LSTHLATPTATGRFQKATEPTPSPTDRSDYPQADNTSTPIYGEHDAVLVDTLATVAEAEALAGWVAPTPSQLHHHLRHSILITSSV
jgi:hypothetical protein